MSRRARGPAHWPTSGFLWWLVAIALVAGLVLPLRGWDVMNINEGQRLLPALQMLESGDWVVPHIEDEVYLAKPPLVYWVIAGSFRLFGATPAAGRAPGLLASALAVLLVITVGRARLGRRAGLLAGLILATTYYFLHKAREAEIDPELVLALLAMAIGLREFLRRPPGRAALGWGALAMAGGAAAMLLKGPVLFPFLLAAMAAGWWAERPGWGRLFGAGGLVAGAAMVAILPWTLAVVHRLGWDEVLRVFHDQAVERLYHSSRINSGPVWFYVVQIGAGGLPWTWLLGFLPLRAFREGRRLRDDAFFRYAQAYALAALVIFSLFSGKETEYLLPIFPWMALLGGGVLDWLLSAAPETKAPWRAAAWVLGVFAGAFVLLPVVLLTSAGRWFQPAPWMPLLVGCGAVVALVCLLELRRGRRGATVTAFLLAVVLVLTAGMDAHALRRQTYKSVRPLAREMRQYVATTGAAAYHWRTKEVHVLWYLHGWTRELPDPGPLAADWPTSGGEAVALMDSDAIDNFHKEYTTRFEIVREEIPPHINYGIVIFKRRPGVGS